LPDAVAMAMSHARACPVWTWDFRHFRPVVLAKGASWRFLMEEHEIL
jgi:hypothetical protein